MQNKCPICGDPECRRVVAGPGVVLISPHPWTHVEPSKTTFLGMPVYVVDDEDGPGEKAAG